MSDGKWTFEYEIRTKGMLTSRVFSRALSEGYEKNFEELLKSGRGVYSTESYQNAGQCGNVISLIGGFDFFTMGELVTGNGYPVLVDPKGKRYPLYE